MLHVSEKEALNQLVSLGLMDQEIAEIIQTLARDKTKDIEPFEGATVRPVVLLLDKSSSMEPLVPAMIEGQHYFLNSLLGAASAIELYLGQILFNHQVDEEYFQDILPFRNSEDDKKINPKIKMLDEENYVPNGGTALYDTIGHSIAMLSPFLFGAEELGQQVLAHIAIITDGKDEHSKTLPETLKKVIDFVLDTGVIHRMTLVGLGNYDYHSIGKKIGIQQVIELESANPKQIRRAVDLISSQIISDGV